MKSLKRTLCLVLALVMVLGMFGIASAQNASEYPDYDDIQYKEAVDVMVGIGVIDGMGDGTINADGNVTRAQAAKMVTYAILGKDNASRLPVSVSSFKDVNSNYAWAIPSIEYLVKQGIVNGRGNGLYDPEGNVTANELAKMLLCSVGYGVNNEYVGNGWDLEVSVDATRLGVFRGCNAENRSAAATREECAKYIFNSIVKINQVVWDKEKGLYVRSQDQNGKEFGTIAAEIYDLVYNNGAPSDAGTLAYTADSTDSYGRPATEWAYKDKTISSLTATPVLTYTGSFVPSEAYKTLKEKGYKFGTNFATVTNGLDGADKTSKSFGSDTKETSDNGIVTEFFVNSRGVVSKQVTINTNFLPIADITEDNAKTAIDERSITFAGGIKATPAAENFDTVYATVKALLDADKEAGALVVLNEGANKATFPVIAVSLPTFAELKVTSVKTSGSDPVSFFADGKTYQYAAGNVAWFASNALTAGSTYTVYFDAYGYAVYAKAIDEVLSVGVLVDTGFMNDGFKDVAQAKILGIDGELTVLPVDTNYNSDKNNIVTFEALTGADEGLYGLNKVSDHSYTDTESLAITNGKVVFGDGSATFNANAKTVFLIETIDAVTGKSTYTTYTGIKNVPTVTESKGYAVYNETDADTYVDVVFVKEAKVKLAATEGVSFIAVDSKEITNADGTVVYDAALITGPAMTDIKATQVSAAVASTLASNPLVSAYTEKNGVVVAVTSYTDDATNKMGAGTGVVAAKNGIVTLNGATHTYSDDCMVWVIDASKSALTEKFVAKKATTITTDTNDTVIWVENKTSGEVSAIYIIKVAPTFTITAPGAISAVSPAGAYTFAVSPTTAAEGATVTVTVTCSTAPDSGTDTVTIKNGATTVGTLTFTGTGEQTCTFTMPASDVTLTATCANS